MMHRGLEIGTLHASEQEEEEPAPKAKAKTVVANGVGVRQKKVPSSAKKQESSSEEESDDDSEDESDDDSESEEESDEEEEAPKKPTVRTGWVIPRKQDSSFQISGRYPTMECFPSAIQCFF